MFKKVSRSIDAVLDWLARVISQPRSELNRYQSAVRFAYDLGRYGGRQLRQDRAPQMAAALAFHTLFGLLPVLVVATVVARTLLGKEEFLGMAASVLEALGLYSLDITESVESTVDVETASVSLGSWLHNIIDQSMGFNLAALGWVGVGVLFYTAISLMVTIENSFNTIYRAPEGRNWTRRVPLYWFVLTISPIAIGITLFISREFNQILDAFPIWGWLWYTIKSIWTLLMIWGIMFGAYSLIPNNSKIRHRSTAVGALVAAILISALIHGLGLYFDNAVSFSKIQGSLGLIPLFMFWVYLMWMVVLFGLEVASALNTLAGRRRVEELEEHKPMLSNTAIEPASIVAIMQFLGSQFVQGESASIGDVAEEVGMNESQLNNIFQRLEEEKLIVRLERPSGHYSLGRPPELIDADDLLEIGFQIADDHRPGKVSAIIQRLRDAQLKEAAEATLATLLAPNRVDPALND